MPLNDISLRKLQPVAKTLKLADGHGLYLQVEPSGGRYWRLKYRFAGKEKRLALGVYPEVSLREARDRRAEARRVLAEGVDPGEKKRQAKLALVERSANSFEAVAREWLAKRGPGWAESHTDKIRRRMERDVYPHMGARPIAEITPPELLAVMRRVEARSLETAHRALRDCGQVMRYGIATGRCERDISADLRGALQPFHSRHMAATLEPKRLGAILRAMDAYPGTPAVAAALKLAPLVFVRPGELRKAEWASIDFEAAEWRFAASKIRTGKPRVEHIVPLSRQALAILRDLRPHTGHGELVKYVFPSARSRRRPMSDNAVLVALRSLDIRKEEMTGHGFRAVARTLLDEQLGFRPDIIEHQLAHAVRDPNGRAYNRTSHLPERRRMMQVWADHLEQIKASTPSNGW